MTQPLQSWNDGATKQTIIDFVERTTTEGGPDFVPLEDRIAVFDNDGTLWTEQPLYNQFLFAVDRVRAMAPDHPEWNDQEPFKSVLAGNIEGALAGGEPALVQLIMASHAGITTEEFNAIVCDWIDTARHPVLKRPYPKTAYKPMIELLHELRATGYKTYIVSGGGVEFMRAFVQDAYGIPPEQVIGSTGKTEFQLRDGNPVLVKLPEVDFIDDGPGKPVGINKFIGRRPVICAGNSDGDQQMLEYTAGGGGPRLMLLVHHDDADRETAYDRDSHVGQLDKALDEATNRGWTVISMKNDFREVFVS